jgi:hypothetical protein
MVGVNEASMSSFQASLELYRDADGDYDCLVSHRVVRRMVLIPHCSQFAVPGDAQSQLRNY